MLKTTTHFVSVLVEFTFSLFETYEFKYFEAVLKKFSAFVHFITAESDLNRGGTVHLKYLGKLRFES